MERGDLGWALGTQPPEGIICHSESVIPLAYGFLDSQDDCLTLWVSLGHGERKAMLSGAHPSFPESQ